MQKSLTSTACKRQQSGEQDGIFTLRRSPVTHRDRERARAREREGRGNRRREERKSGRERERGRDGLARRALERKEERRGRK